MEKKFRSGLVDTTQGTKYFVLAVTEEGLEVSAAAEGFSLDYSGSWQQIKRVASRERHALRSATRAVPEPN